MLWIVFFLLILFFWVKANSNSSDIQHTSEPALDQPIYSQLDIDLSLLFTLPDRNQAISFHKKTILKSYDHKDYEQLNLSFAKLIESYRQLNIDNDDELAREQSVIKSLYDSLASKLNLSYPTNFLPPKERKEAKVEAATVVIKKFNRFLSIDRLGYFGPYKESLNKRFTVSWSDSDPVTRTGGFRASGKGTYILLDGDKIGVKERLDRPNNGMVGNNGNFILSDSGFGEGLKGSLCAFSSNGTSILERKFKANILHTAISPEGDYAVCQTANSPNAHGNLLTFFDLMKGEVVWSQKNEVFWANSYLFDSDKQTLLLQSRDYGEYAFSYDGVFLDKERYESDREKRAAPFELVDMAKELLNRFSVAPDAEKKEIREKIFYLTNRLIVINEGVFPAEKSYGLRIQGEVFESETDFEKAMKLYEDALKIYPKVGVKRRLAALKKRK